MSDVPLIPKTDPSAIPPAHPKPTAFELLISTLLRTGVSVSFTLIVLGAILSFAHHPGYSSSPTDLQRLTSPGNASMRTLHDVFIGLRQLRGQALVAAGLILLIATPVLRVAVAIFAFLAQKDRVFALITTIVLLLLLLSLLLGKATA